jgi:hypothetical protein
VGSKTICAPLHVFESDKDQWIILAVAVVNVPFLALILLDNKSAEKLEVFLNDFAPSVCIDFSIARDVETVHERLSDHIHQNQLIPVIKMDERIIENA